MTENRWTALVPAGADRNETYEEVKAALGDMRKGFGQMLSGNLQNIRGSGAHTGRGVH